MDFLDPNKQHSFTIRLFIGYALVAIAILLATTLLIMYAYGFRLNRDGQLNQMGLVFISSQPTDASLYIDGKPKDTTNVKLRLTAGKYDVKMVREGYHDWERRITVDGGSVDHYVYPLLIPTELSPIQLDTFGAQPLLASQSLDQRWLLVQPTSAEQFTEYDMNRRPTEPPITKQLAVPEALLTSSTTAAKWQVVAWADTNRHVLMTRQYTTEVGSAQEYILLDRGRIENSRNLTQLFGLTPNQKLSLRDQQPELYFVHNEETKELNTVSLDDPRPAPLLEEVEAFKSHGRNMLLYVSSEGAAEGQVRVMLRDNNRSYFVRALPNNTKYLLDIARYERDWYVVAAAESEGKAFIYKNPIDIFRNNQAEKPIVNFVIQLEKPTSAAFSANAQFLAVQNNTSIHIYDAEHVRAHRYELPFSVDKPQNRAKWMDGHRFSYVSNNKQVMFEYDNNYQQEIMDALPALGGFYNRNATYLYTFAKPASSSETKQVGLMVTPLRLEADL